jgi:predicted nucleic acid-binding protein
MFITLQFFHELEYAVAEIYARARGRVKHCLPDLEDFAYAAIAALQNHEFAL